MVRKAALHKDFTACQSELSTFNHYNSSTGLLFRLFVQMEQNEGILPISLHQHTLPLAAINGARTKLCRPDKHLLL